MHGLHRVKVELTLFSAPTGKVQARTLGLLLPRTRGAVGIKRRRYLALHFRNVQISMTLRHM